MLTGSDFFHDRKGLRNYFLQHVRSMSVAERECPIATRTRRGGEVEQATVTLKLGAEQNHTKSH